MNNQLVIAALGEDKPGLVDRLSGWVTDSGCNIADSRMTVLGGEFAVLLLVTGNWNNLAKLENQCDAMQDQLGMTLHIKRTEQRPAEGDYLPYGVDVVALDHPGIVHNLASFFSQRNINIQDLSTSTYAAAHTGTQMFAVHMVLDVPASTHIATLREEFLDFCDRLNLDAVIEPVKG
ncbi:glycine cleavage system transcriptional repressor [Thiogranum longum]|uniref:Glycine cleavage system transcriptional repressor n=1 Tax=Thiogranum longum TaxID=1537524 RepID=A0A4R1H6P3_9GAMM|nr:ACT domain-containing protein [Thiogranum longum]TCK17414.1 glycine cleavage system transcriptional repressor [Thiogranum longum]